MGQEFPRCTGFCLGLSKESDSRKGRHKKLAGIKYGVWQLHILLIDGIRGLAYGPFQQIDSSLCSVWLMVSFGLGTSFGCCRLFFLFFCGVFLHWWSEGVFHHRPEYPLLFLRQSNCSVGFNQSLLLSGWGLGCGVGWLCDAKNGSWIVP